MDFTGGSVVTNPSFSAQDMNSAQALGSGRSPGKGNGNPLQYWEIPWREEPARLQSMGSQRLSNYAAITTTTTMTVHIEHLLYAYVLCILFGEVFQLSASPSHLFQLSCLFSYY